MTKPELQQATGPGQLPASSVDRCSEEHRAAQQKPGDCS